MKINRRRPGNTIMSEVQSKMGAAGWERGSESGQLMAVWGPWACDSMGKPHTTVAYSFRQ